MSYNPNSLTAPATISPSTPYPSLPYVTPEMFYQASDGSDWGLAINRALTHSYRVVLGVFVYTIQTTIRYQSYGQIIEGQGQGFATDVGPTILKWTGANNGKVVSFAPSAGANAISNCQLRDLDVDGNAIANIGVEVYDNSASTGGGCWRNQLWRVTVRNVTHGVTPVGIDLGHSNSAPNFANDFSGWHTNVYNCNYGVWLNGSTENFYMSTIGFCSTAGVRIETGGEWNGHSCVLQNNGIDVSANNPFSIGLFGGSCQDSTTGIVILDNGATQNSTFISGAYLHTSNATQMFEFRAAAGGWSIIGCKIAADTSSAVVSGINPAYSYSVQGTTGLTLSSSGAVFLDSTVASGSAVSLTNATPANITSLSLQPGTWDISGSLLLNVDGSTVTSSIQGGFNTTSATLPTAPNAGGYAFIPGITTAGVAPSLILGPQRMVLTQTTTVYLVVQAAFSVSTAGGFGYLRAQKVNLYSY